MSNEPRPGIVHQGWDGPYYRVRTDHFEASFLPDPDEDLGAVRNVDVEVRLVSDGSRWSATVFTLTEVERLMRKDAQTGENLGGRYFWCFNGLLVRDPGIESITAVLIGLYENDDLDSILHRLDDD